jgi:hypothetical protein
MLLTEINIDDLDKLKQLRLERLQCFFASSLPFCQIQIDVNNVLAIYSPHAGIMEEIMNELEELRYYACLILGVKSITLHLAQMEVFCTDIYPDQSKA